MVHPLLSKYSFLPSTDNFGDYLEVEPYRVDKQLPSIEWYAMWFVLIRIYFHIPEQFGARKLNLIGSRSNALIKEDSLTAYLFIPSSSFMEGETTVLKCNGPHSD